MNEYKGGSIKENLTELKLYFSAEWVQFLQHINNVNQYCPEPYWIYSTGVGTLSVEFPAE